jgi:genome maintenance exonuclease 1
MTTTLTTKKWYTHISTSFPKLEKIEGSTRTYLTPTGKKYPSVTSVTSLESAAGIAAWRASIGNEKANTISGKAMRRGTSIHNLCESYLLNDGIDESIFESHEFKLLIPYLNKIDNIYALETPMYSDHLTSAGTVDCIAEYDKSLCVIDFKTSNKSKTADKIKGYFMQTAAYAVMFEEHTKIPVPNIKIIMLVQNPLSVLIFDAKRNDYIKDYIKLRETYRKLKNL